ncbi:MAG: hypothetical protein SFX73_29720 [Kofleriaceae bacterium]|nr:hypothetical protein [Kofleriaceae bacterium]
MNSAQLIKWSTLHERRGRPGGLLGSPFVLALLAGCALAAWVAWRGQDSFAAASHAWLAGTLATFAVAFIRVPFHVYWRGDAALLAQLPIEGGPLLDAALWRCMRAAAATTLAVMIGAVPLYTPSTELLVRHLVIAGVLGVVAALLIPAVAIGAAALVAISQGEAIAVLRVAAGIDGAAKPRAETTPPAPSTALLGALPGFAATGVIVGVVLLARWLTGEKPAAPPAIVLALLGGASVVALVLVRGGAPKIMGRILRDVSALDRQRLAPLEVRDPTGIERAIMRMIGAAALPYSKDARLMRRRYPMAFALGGLVFLILVIVSLATPEDPTPWLVATLVGATAYGLAVGGRLHRPPIELSRLSHTLPISAAAVERAKLAWLAGWWTIFVVIPGLLASLRQDSPLEGLILLGSGTLLVLGAELLRIRVGP